MRVSEYLTKHRAIFSASHRLFTFSALGIAHPIYTLFSKSSTYFVALDIPRTGIFLFIFILSFLLPLALTALVALSSIGGDKARNVVETCVVSVLAGLMFLNLLKSGHFLPATALLVIAYGLSIVFAHQYTSNPSFRGAFIFLFPLALLIPTQFVLQPSMKSILFPHELTQASMIEIERTPPVVVVVWDELPLHTLLGADGKIDASRFPSFAELADTSTWYANATSVSWRTGAALPAIVTGMMPDSSLKPPTRAEHPLNIFSLLEHKYAIHALEPSTALSSIEIEGIDVQQSIRLLLSDASILYLRALLPSELADYLRVPDISNHRWGGFAPKNKTEKLLDAHWRSGRGEQAVRFIGEIGEVSTPTLHFLHLLLPHRPFTYLPNGTIYGSLEGHLKGSEQFWPFDQAYVEGKEYAHRLQTAYVDSLLGSLIEQLKLKGLFDESLIVVTADHGISFLEDEPIRMLTPKNYAGVAFVPLLIKYPNQRAAQIDRSNVQTIDILPTILDVLGSAGTLPQDGRSLLNPNDAIPTHKMIITGVSRDEEESRGWGDRAMVLGEEKNLYNEVVVRLSEEEYLQSREELLRLKVETFSLDDARATLTDFGPGLVLIGESYAGLQSRAIPCEISSATESASLSLNVTARLNEKSDGTVNALLSGKVSGLTEQLEDLLVVVGINGIVEATSRLYDADGETSFSVFIPEKVFSREIVDAEIMVIR